MKCGVARPRDQPGGWLINSDEQCLLSLRVPENVSPYISDGKRSIPFPRGKAVYCAPSNYVFVSADVEFACIHWAAE